MNLDFNNLWLVDESQESFENLLNAVSNGDTKKVDKILDNVEKGFMIDERDTDGQTLLHLAVMKNPAAKIGKHQLLQRRSNVKNVAAMAKIFLKNKKNIDAQIKAIPSAERCNMIKMLIENGANVNSKDKNGLTPLHIAVKDNEIDLAKILLHHGADIEAKSKYAHTPLTLAVEADLIDMTIVLIENGANVNTDSRDRTPIFRAVELNLVAMTKLLIQNGADVDVLNHWGHPPLIGALFNHKDPKYTHKKEIFQILVENSTIINSKTPQRDLLLRLVIELQAIESLKILVANGLSIATKIIAYDLTLLEYALRECPTDDFGMIHPFIKPFMFYVHALMLSSNP